MKKFLCLFLAMAMLTGCGKQNELPAEEIVEAPIEELLVEEEPQLSIYEEDALYLIEQVEALHPCFVMDDTPENYEETKAEYLEAAKTMQDMTDFAVESWRYIKTMNDAHMSIGIRGICDKILELNGIWCDNIYWLEDENGLKTDIKIVSIDGVEPRVIWSVMEELFPMENESAYNGIHSNYAMFGVILELAGVDTTQGELEIIFETDGEQYSEQRKLLSREDYMLSYPNSIFSQKDTAVYEMIGDVFYLDLNAFKIDGSLNAATTALKESIENGTSKIIIDLRENSGGNSQAGSQILAAMGMLEPVYTVSSRLKDSSVVQKVGPGTDIERVGKNNPNIDLIVLSDEITFSSGNMFCVWTQDGNLGRVVGRPSCNNPTAYGNIIQLQTPNLEYTFCVSCCYLERPNVNANHDIFEVDVYVPHDTDALEVALEMLAE